MTNGISSGTVEVQCSDLTGLALDWAVAKAVGKKLETHGGRSYVPGHCGDSWSTGQYVSSLTRWSPSNDWSQAGPLISKYLMDFTVEHPETIGAALCDENGIYIDDRMMFGKTHLIAACRAIIAAHLGEVVSVPAELVENKSPE